jgi:integrase
MARREFRVADDTYPTRCLSRRAGDTEDQRQQTHHSHARSACKGIQSHFDQSENRSHLVFSTRTGKPYSDTNLLARVLRPAGVKIGAPWLSWHTLRRTHATLLSESGASPNDAQAQPGHAHISTTMDIYTQPTPQHQRDAVNRLSELVTNGDELSIWGPDAALATLQIQ